MYKAVGVGNDYPKGIELLKKAGNLGIIYDTGENL
jgi:hypothetical protein